LQGFWYLIIFSIVISHKYYNVIKYGLKYRHIYWVVLFYCH